MILQSQFLDVEIPRVPIAQYALEKMEHFGSLVALVDPNEDESWTFSKLRQQSINFALKLRSIGVEKGDVVGLVVDFYPISFSLALGIILCKATLVAGDITNKPKILGSQLKHAKAKYCICQNFQLKKDVQEETAELIVYDVHDILNIRYIEDEKMLVEITSSHGVDVELDPLIVAFTSGSTGLSKAIVNVNRNFMTCSMFAEVVLGMKAGDCMMIQYNQVNMFGIWCFFTFLVSGVKLVLTKTLPPHLFLQCIKKHNLNGVFISDIVTLKTLIDEVTLEPNDPLRFVLTGGSLVPKVDMQSASEKFHAVVTSAYGCTESQNISLTVTKQTPYGGVGMLCPNVQLKVIDVNDGAELGPGDQGEFYVKSPGVFKGYLSKKETTEAVLDECGWLRTGDLGYFDEQGIVYVIDRIKHIIKSQGRMVFPALLEEVLMSHPDVAEAVVVHTAHPVYNEAAKAFVVKKSEDLTKEELFKFYNAHVAEYQQLFGGLEFIEHIPKTGPEKPDKSALLKKDR